MRTGRLSILRLCSRPFSSRQSTPCVEKVQKLATLFTIPSDSRDDLWRSVFYANVTEASLKMNSPNVKKGPDGFSYLHLTVPVSNEPFAAYSIEMLREFLITNAVGVVIESSENSVEWVFSHGDILNLHLNGEYYSQIENVGDRIGVVSDENSTTENNNIVIKAGSEILVGAPSESYLPIATRNALRSFMELSGVINPKVTLLARKPNVEDGKVGVTNKELCFYCEEENISLTAKKDINIIYKEGVPWFLPRHYQILYVDRDDDEFELKPL